MGLPSIQTFNGLNVPMTPSRIALALMVFSLVTACGGGSADSADHSAIIGLTVDNAALPTQLVIANADNQTIQKLTLRNGALTLLAGAASASGSVDGTGSLQQDSMSLLVSLSVALIFS